MAFSEQGISIYRHTEEPEYKKQKGYLLWQKFLPGNEYDLRVIMIAKKYAYIVKRYNRKDIPLASGSDDMKLFTELDDELIKLLNFSLGFVRKNNISVAALDVLKDENGEFRLIESHCNWGMKLMRRNRQMFKITNGVWAPLTNTKQAYRFF